MLFLNSENHLLKWNNVTLINKIKKYFKLNRLFSYNEYFCFKYDLEHNIIHNNELPFNFSKKIVHTLNELEILNKNSNCLIGIPPIYFKYIRKKNCILYLYFINNLLAHVNCIWIKKSGLSSHRLKIFNNENTIFIGPAYTIHKYRGMGFHVYDMLESCKEYKNKKYKIAYADTKTNNKISLLCFVAAGFKYIGKAATYTILHFSFSKFMD